MRLCPGRAWFGLTKKLLRIIGITTASIFAACLLLYGGAWLLLVVEAHRAAALLNQLNSIQLGQSEASVLDLFQRYEDVNYEREIGVDRGRVLRVDPWGAHRPLGPSWIDTPILEMLPISGNWRRRLGLRLWVVQGGMRIADHKVKSVWADLDVEGENEWLKADWSYESEIPAAILQHLGDNTRPEMARYLIRWTHLHVGYETGEGIQNLITPAGTPEEQHAARSINLQCLTSMRGCHSLCELMPDANRYRREHHYPGWGWNSGSWGRQDSACE